MKYGFTAFISFVILLSLFTGCSGTQKGNQAVNQQKSNGKSISQTTSASQDKQNSGESSAKNTEKAGNEKISGSVEDIEAMLKGIANEDANIIVEDSKSADADSLANQLNSALNTDSDNINGLN